MLSLLALLATKDARHKVDNGSAGTTMEMIQSTSTLASAVSLCVWRDFLIRTHQEKNTHTHIEQRK